MPRSPCAAVLMGVSGSGKTTVGREVARRLGWTFLDADDFHTPAARRKMASGVPLDDADRAPWLERLRDALRARREEPTGTLLACSALRKRYRRILGGRGVLFVYLAVPRAVLEGRLAARGGHFFSPLLLDSQLDTLEVPDDAVTVDATAPVEVVADEVTAALVNAASGWIDVSVPLRTGMVKWPDNPPVEIVRTMDLARGDACTLSALSMGAHTGTHVDAPSHFIAGAPSLDALPVGALAGPARVIAIRDPLVITPAELARHRIRRGERILFRTRNSETRWHTRPFDERFVHVEAAGAAYLAERRVRMIGVDYLSAGGYLRDGRETHLALLGAGIWILEGLDLSRVAPGPVELLAAPLRIVDGDGAPARAFVRPAGRSTGAS